MSDSVSEIESFARRPLKFRCKPPEHNASIEDFPAALVELMGTIPPPEARFEVSVKHELRGAASAADLSLLRTLLGESSPPFEKFYARHDGFILYKDPLSRAAGVEAIQVKDWREATAEMRKMVGKCPRENDPANVLSGVAFAHAPQSGNFFVVPVAGNEAGKIFYANHDGWYRGAFASGFDDFVQKVTSDPVSLFNRLGGYARYSDGKGCIQWIPNEVV